MSDLGSVITCARVHGALVLVISDQDKKVQVQQNVWNNGIYISVVVMTLRLPVMTYKLDWV